MHLPLRSVVMDRVTEGAVRGVSLYRGREKYLCNKNNGRQKRARDGVMAKREEKKVGDLVLVKGGMCKGEKVERG